MLREMEDATHYHLFEHSESTRQPAAATIARSTNMLGKENNCSVVHDPLCVGLRLEDCNVVNNESSSTKRCFDIKHAAYQPQGALTVCALNLLLGSMRGDAQHGVEVDIAFAHEAALHRDAWPPTQEK